MPETLFESWTSLGRTMLAGVLGYGILVVVLRISGKRTLSKLNAFDLVVTVALGSTLASVLTSRQLPLADGALAMGLLVTLQLVVAWSATRSRRWNRLVKSEPRVLFHRGSFCADAMRDERVTRDEILAAARKATVASLDDVEAVILEASGDLSVVRRPARGSTPQGLLDGVRMGARGADEPREGPRT